MTDMTERAFYSELDATGVWPRPEVADTAAEWHPVTDDGECPVTYSEWTAQRAAKGLPWKPIYVYLRLAPWLTSEWTGATCPLCDARLQECRAGVLCPACGCSWAGLDAVEATRAAMAAMAVLTDKEVDHV